MIYINLNGLFSVLPPETKVWIWISLSKVVLISHERIVVAKLSAGVKYMNQEHLIEICKTLQLGLPIGSATSVHGGLSHRMWRIDTNDASYAIKQLSHSIDLQNEAIKKNYELSEQVAAHFSEQGIRAVSAIANAGKYLIEINKETYLVYPWVNAKALNQDVISGTHAKSIASLMARMHHINLDITEIQALAFDIHSTDILIDLIDKNLSHDFNFSSALKEILNQIPVIIEMYQRAIPLLNKQVVVSHGDLDQKNVLWDNNDSPIIIDWEAACKVNPTYEIIAAALDWSGLMTCATNKEIFIGMLNAYQTNKGVIDPIAIEASIYYHLGGGLNWLKFNLERVINHPPANEEHVIAKEQVQLSSAAISYLYQRKNKIQAMICETVS